MGLRFRSHDPQRNPRHTAHQPAHHEATAHNRGTLPAYLTVLIESGAPSRSQSRGCQSSAYWRSVSDEALSFNPEAHGPLSLSVL